MPTCHADHLIWIDLEMTGLDPLSDSIIEIATLVTDAQLNVLAEGPELAVRHPLERLEAIGASAIIETRIGNCRL